MSNIEVRKRMPLYDNSLNYSHDILCLFEKFAESCFRIIEINASFELEFGVTRAHCLGKTLEELLDESTASILIKKLRNCVDRDQTIEDVVEIGFSEEKQLYKSTSIPLRNEAGQVNKVLVVKHRISPMSYFKQVYFIKDTGQKIEPAFFIKNINMHVDLETIKRQTNFMMKRVRELYDCAPYAILILIRATPVYVNQALLDLANAYSFEDFLQQDCIQYIHKNDRNQAINLVRKISQKDISDSFQLSVRLITKNGSLKYLDLRLVSSYIGNVKLIQIMAFDVTEETEKELLLDSLASSTLTLTQSDEYFKSIKKELDLIIQKNDYKKCHFQKLYTLCNCKVDDTKNWGLFNKHFSDLHPSFFSNIKIICPTLTINDIKHCACIRMNLETKEIAQFFNVSPTSIQKARVRLKKKLNLPENIDLRTWIENI